MEDVSHRDFSLCQMLLNGKGACHVLGCDQMQEPRVTKTIFSLKTSFRAVRLRANLLCAQISHVATIYYLKFSDFTALISELHLKCASLQRSRLKLFDFKFQRLASSFSCFPFLLNPETILWILCL